MYVDRGMCATPGMLEALAAGAPMLKAIISDSKDPIRSMLPKYKLLAHVKLVDDYWHQVKSFIRPALKTLGQKHPQLRCLQKPFEGFLYSLQVLLAMFPINHVVGGDALRQSGRHQGAPPLILPALQRASR
jgi:hypothetical protein